MNVLPPPWEGFFCLYGTVAEAGIDEMPKSEIEKRKRNMDSISRISRREKRNVEICFLRKRNFENKFHDS